MLILSRRAGEGVHIGEDVRVIVLSVQGGTVRIGVKAPRSVAVHRDEVAARIEAERAASPGDEQPTESPRAELPLEPVSSVASARRGSLVERVRSFLK